MFCFSLCLASAGLFSAKFRRMFRNLETFKFAKDWKTTEKIRFASLHGVQAVARSSRATPTPRESQQCGSFSLYPCVEIIRFGVTLCNFLTIFAVRMFRRRFAKTTKNGKTMATFHYEVSRHRKADGTYLVSVRMTHGRRLVRRPTSIFVTRDQLSRDGKRVKDAAVLDAVERLLGRLRAAVGQIDCPESY